MAMVWFLLENLQITLSVSMSKGRPKRMSYAGNWTMWTCIQKVRDSMRKGTLQAGPSDRLQFPFADCMFSLMRDCRQVQVYCT